MKYVDLHIHSPYSKATSPYITPDAIISECKDKSIDIVGTGDILVEEWQKEWEEYMNDNDNVKTADVEVIPTVEVSSIDRNKQCHILLVMLWEHIDKVRQALKDWGNLEQGRPSTYLNLQDLKDAVKSVSEDVLFIPAHCFTPWYGIMGYRYGWTPQQVSALQPDALETGLSASREMIWSISCLQSIPLVSFSDAHKVDIIGREVTMIPSTMTFYEAIKTKNYWTLELPPELGKYYLNGHRNCNTSSATDTTCPLCGKQYTIGVKYTVSRYKDDVSPINDTYAIPLSDVLLKTEIYTLQTTAKQMDILSGMEVSDNELLNNILADIRAKRILFKEGYDGKYGSFEI